MMGWSMGPLAMLVRPTRMLAKALLADDSPRELALGLAIGMLLGLIPKGNLTAVLLSMLLLSLRANVAIGAMSAFVFSWIGMLLDPIAHRLGLAVLGNAWLDPLWSWCYELPFVAWTHFNNSVVMGNLLLGLVLFYPTLRLAERLAIRLRPLVVARLRKYRVAHLLLGTELATSWSTK